MGFNVRDLQIGKFHYMFIKVLFDFLPTIVQLFSQLSLHSPVLCYFY